MRVESLILCGRGKHRIEWRLGNRGVDATQAQDGKQEDSGKRRGAKMPGDITAPAAERRQFLQIHALAG